jgi:hypothetical protein
MRASCGRFPSELGGDGRRIWTDARSWRSPQRTRQQADRRLDRNEQWHNDLPRPIINIGLSRGWARTGCGSRSENLWIKLVRSDMYGATEMTNPLVVVIASIVAGGCREHAAAQSAPQAAAVDSIVLERTPCFGTCDR